MLDRNYKKQGTKTMHMIKVCQSAKFNLTVRLLKGITLYAIQSAFYTFQLALSKLHGRASSCDFKFYSISKARKLLWLNIH